MFNKTPTCRENLVYITREKFFVFLEIIFSHGDKLSLSSIHKLTVGFVMVDKN